MMTTAAVLLRPEILAARLRDLGIASPRQLEQAKQELSSSQERFSAILVRQGLLRDPDAGKRLAAQLGSVPRPLEGSATPALGACGPIGPGAQRVPAALWRAQRLVPLQETEGRLLAATDDPLAVFALEFFSARCGCPLEATLIREQDLEPLLQGLERALTPDPPAALAPSPLLRGGGEAAVPSQAGIGEAGRSAAPSSAPPAPRPAAAPQPPPGSARPPAAPDGEDEPIIRLVDSMLSEAVRMRASDIHIEPGRDEVRVRYRVDGVLRDAGSPPRALHGPIVSRVKIVAGLNIAEKRLPQDGRLQLSVDPAGGGAGARPLDVRISTLPAMYGESIVMRLLDRSQPVRGLEEMGMLPEDRALWDRLIRRPHGMVLVTGPTGSGKTTTLYGAMAALNQADRKLITVEDPVEYQLAGINQVQVKAAIGLTFAAGLRSMLRQAPDVIMVGEIRDRETAQIAVQAALTGHLVFSTLHTNDAPSAVTRLIDMGIAPFLIASTMQAALAQRLVRRICLGCRITDNATADERAFLGSPEVSQVIRSSGCDKCHGSGYFGRIGVYELLAVTEPLRQLIVSKASASALRAAAIAGGMRTLRDDGIVKVRDGLTTMAEVLRVVTEAEN